MLPQLGKQSVWHDWNHILHGTLSVDIYACPQCGKIEFFMPEAVTSAIHNAEKPAEGMHIAAYRCGSCGKCVPGEFKICPACGEEDAVLLPQVKCPVCGTLHDFDDPKCPSCGNR